MRNFENLKKSLDEIYRVLKKNGTLVILETSVPKNKIIKLFYNFFTKFYVKLILVYTIIELDMLIFYYKKEQLLKEEQTLRESNNLVSHYLSADIRKTKLL